MELFGKSYDRIYELPEGVIGLLADIYIDGETLILKDLSVYPIGSEIVSLGVTQVLSIRSKIDEEVRKLGFKRFRNTAERLTGASRGRAVDAERKLP